MGRSSRKSARRAAAAAAALVVLALLWTRRPANEPARVDAGLEAERVGAPAAAPAAPASEPELPPEQRPYVRRLDLVDVPPPGAARPYAPAARAARAAVRAEGFSAGSLALVGGSPAADAESGEFARGGEASRAAAPLADGRPGAANAVPKSTGAAAGADRGAPTSDLRSLPEAAGVLAGVRKLKDASAALARPWEGTPAGAALAQQLINDARVDAGVREALGKLAASGDASPEARARAVSRVLSANGLPSTPDEIALATARASGPPPQPIPPGVAARTAQELLAVQATPQEAAQILQQADVPASPNSPPPRGALEAFAQNKAVFQKALDQYGVQPQDILAILGVETSYGNNTGSSPLAKTLGVLSQETVNGRPTARAAQAARDYAALYRLAAEGNLGGQPIAEIRSSYAGAIGFPQFLPTSWEAYGTAAGSGAKNPWNMPDSVLSVANYLNGNGYHRSVTQSFFAYNHSADYVNKVNQLSTNIAAGLQRQSSPSAPAPAADAAH